MPRVVTSLSVASILALVGFASVTAAADPHASSAKPAVNATPANASIPDPSAPVCAPSCRVGFTCVQGACVSACNPGCGEGEQCTSDGQCVAKPMTPKSGALAPPVVAPPPVHDPDADAAPPSSPKKGVRTHDGFYMRLALGPAYFNATWKGGTQDATVTGMGPGLELAFGGTPLPGLVIGGGSYGTFISSPTLSYAGQSADGGSTSLSIIGPFVDWYPEPSQGFHVLASAGVAYVSYGSKGGGATVSGTGLGLTGGVGYEIWVGDQWSLGAQFRMQYASPSIKSDGMTSSVDTTTLVPALIVGATYH